MIASFGNSTLVSRVKFPKLAIMTCGGPTCWAGGHDLAEWRHPLAQPHQAETTRLTTYYIATERDHTYATYRHGVIAQPRQLRRAGSHKISKSDTQSCTLGLKVHDCV